MDKSLGTDEMAMPCRAATTRRAGEVAIWATLPARGRVERARPSLACGPVSFETAVQQWREGERRLANAPASERAVLERVTSRVVTELRRRLGGSFTTAELAELYDRGTTWVLDVAVAAAPEAPWAWEQRVVGDAAFGRYVREAADFAGGRRVEDRS
jgi:hypothetical protein